MAQNDQSNSRIDFINIDCESNYFDTREQIKLRGVKWFAETTVASRVSGSNTVTGLFSQTLVKKNKSQYSALPYATSSFVIDPSGETRNILSTENDYLVSSSMDSYRNGIDIREDKHWTAGVAKISAGTPGHLFTSTLFGVTDTSLVDPDKYYEIDVFDPVGFVESGGDPAKIAFPIVTSDSNEVENYILNGIIEPFPIRSVISNFSINFPFEPHSTRGEYSSGNSSTAMSTDQVLSVDYYTPQIPDNSPYLDAVDHIGLYTDQNTGVTIGPAIGYFTQDKNVVPAFEDAVHPRGESPSPTYGVDLINALVAMAPGGTTYVTGKQKSGTAGFVYENSPAGTDSIAFGGLLY
jgi:hypothetical protein